MSYPLYRKPPMELPSLEECLIVAGGLFVEKEWFSFVFFGNEIKFLLKKTRERKLLEYLGQYYIGLRILKSVQTIHEQRVMSEISIRDFVIENNMKQVDALCRRVLVSRDPAYFSSKNYTSSVYLVSVRVYKAARELYKEVGYM